MPGWFHQEQFASWLQGFMDIGKQRRRIPDLMDHREGQREIDLPSVVVDAKAIAFGQARNDAVRQPGFCCPFDQSLEHFWLHINCEYAAFGADAASHLEREESHARSRFEDDHSLRYKWPNDFCGVVKPAAQWACKEITEPPWTHMMSHNRERNNLRTRVKPLLLKHGDQSFWALLPVVSFL